MIHDSNDLSPEDIIQVLKERYTEGKGVVYSIEDLEKSNPDLPINTLKSWAIREKGQKLLPLLKSEGIISDSLTSNDRSSIEVISKKEEPDIVSDSDGEVKRTYDMNAVSTVSIGISKKRYLINKTVPQTYRFMMESLNDDKQNGHMSIPVGEEPEDVKKRMNTLFAKLDYAYPDKEIVRLDADHKKWGETATELYRKLGYSDRRSFLEAYGYTFRHNEQQGRPKNDYKRVIDDLRKRYADGPVYYNVEQLFSANPDLESNHFGLRHNAIQLFGMPLGEYLIQEGILRDQDYDLEYLKSKYKEPYEGDFEALQKENQLDWSKLGKYVERAYRKPLDRYLFTVGILKEDPSEVSERKKREEAEQEIQNALKILKEKYPFPYEGDYKQLKKEDPGIISWYRFERAASALNIGSANELLFQRGILKYKTDAEFALDSVLEKLKEKYLNSAQKPFSYKEVKEACPGLPVGSIQGWLRRLGIEDTPTEFLKRNKILDISSIADGVLKNAGPTGQIAIVPEGVRVIGYKAFYRNDDVRIIFLPSTVKTIEMYAFDGCDNLEEIRSAGPIKTVYPESFFDCPALVRLSNFRITQDSVYRYGDSVTNRVRVRDINHSDISDIITPGGKKLYEALEKLFDLVEKLEVTRGKPYPVDKEAVCRDEAAYFIMFMMYQTADYTPQTFNLYDTVRRGRVPMSQLLPHVMAGNLDLSRMWIFKQIAEGSPQKYEELMDIYIECIEKITDDVVNISPSEEMEECKSSLMRLLNDATYGIGGDQNEIQR